MAVLEVQHLKKIYTTRFGGNRVQALADVSFSVEEGEFVAIMGESGSGKTTLLNILAALDRPTSGTVLLNGTDLSGIKEHKMAAFRRDNLGFVFQDFNLLDTFSVKDNIFLPLVLSKTPYEEMERRLAPLAGKLGLADLLNKFPYEISSGQKQRTAAARALITNPHILLADEPTGALDSRTGEQVLGLMRQMNAEGTTVILITHDNGIAAQADRTVRVKDGRIVHDSLWDGVLVDWSAPPARVAP